MSLSLAGPFSRSVLVHVSQLWTFPLALFAVIAFGVAPRSCVAIFYTMHSGFTRSWKIVGASFDGHRVRACLAAHYRHAPVRAAQLAHRVVESGLLDHMTSLRTSLCFISPADDYHARRSGRALGNFGNDCAAHDYRLEDMLQTRPLRRRLWHP